MSRIAARMVVVALAVLMATPGLTILATSAGASAMVPGSVGHAGGGSDGASHRSLTTSRSNLATSLARSDGTSPRAPAVRTAGSVGASGPTIFGPSSLRPSEAPAASGGSGYQPGTPSPMGISDLGIGPGANYTYWTNSFEGILNLTSFAAFTPTNSSDPTDLDPNWAVLELDAVAVNVTMPPASPAASDGTFWVQNVLRFNGTAVELEDNIVNFTSSDAPLAPSALHGVHGGIGVADGVAAYVGTGPAFTVAAPSPSSPLSIELFDNITTVARHTVVTFGYRIGSHAGNYDVVTFNGTSLASVPAQFEVNGSAFNPAGSFYDAEFVLGGNGDGANANFVGLNGTARLLRNNTTYQPVPSAFDFGVDSGETALGVAVAYAGTTAYLTAGPSFTYGLWNTNGSVAESIAPSAAPGWIDVRIQVVPSYAVLFAINSSGLAESLVAANYSYAPTNESGELSTFLPPTSFTYTFRGWADGYASSWMNISGAANTTGRQTLSLPSSPATLDAPVYLLGESEALQFAAHGVDHGGYSPALKTIWLNASSDALAAPFLRMNAMDYPTFPLVATWEVNLSIDLNGFVQAPTTFNYSVDGRTVAEFQGWTQGYFFIDDGGNDSVQNTTVEGVAATATPQPAISPPSTVEYYGSDHATVANLTAADDAVGVELLGADDATVRDLTVVTGAIGVWADGAEHLSVVDANATGTNPVFGYPSIAGDLDDATTVSFADLAVASGGLGLESDGGSGLTVSQATVASGAQGLALNDTGSSSVSTLSVVGGIADGGSWTNSSGLTLSRTSVNGTGLFLGDDTSVTVSDSVATGSALTFLSSQGGSGVTIDDLTVHGNAIALGMNATGASSLSDLVVDGGLASAGTWSNSTGLTISSVTVNGSGLVLTDDVTVSVDGGHAVGFDSTVVQSFAGSRDGTFSGLSANDLATAANLLFCSTVNASQITATNGSVGVYLANATGVVGGTGFSSSALSIGLVLENVSAGTPTFTGFTVADESLGAYVANSSNVHLGLVNATNASLGAAAYFANATSLQDFPISGVELLNDTAITVTNVSATAYPFAVWSLYSLRVTVSEVTDWYGGSAVVLNATNNSHVSDVFAFGDLLGISVQNTSGTTVETSTIESSAGVGLELANGTGDTIVDNNFIGNNDSSTLGVYNASDLQVWVNNSLRPAIHDNFWADRTSGAYVINATAGVQDSSPLTALYATNLELDEYGLAPGTNWSVVLAGRDYTMNDTMLVVPGWALPASANLPFSVPRVVGYPVPKPDAGTIGWSDKKFSETIYFATPPSTPSSRPPFPWLYVGIGIGAAVVAAGVGLFLLRRHRRAQAPPPPRQGGTSRGSGGRSGPPRDQS